jgi:hypothetical protein
MMRKYQEGKLVWDAMFASFDRDVDVLFAGDEEEKERLMLPDAMALESGCWLNEGHGYNKEEDIEGWIAEWREERAVENGSEDGDEEEDDLLAYYGHEHEQEAGGALCPGGVNSDETGH